MTNANLPSLRDSLDAHGLLARKSFGQHFLHDPAVLQRIVAAIGIIMGRSAGR